MNSKILKSGHIKLYKRENSKFWQMKIKLPKQKAIRSSSGTKILKEADYYINELRKKGKIIGKGYGSLTNQIRIANFPTHSKEVFESLCDELNQLK